MPRSPTWEDWLRSAKICEKSIRFFEKPKIAAIKTFSKRIAQDNISGHLKKAYHNLDLANKVFNTSFITQKGLAERALTDAREFIAKIRELLEEGMGGEFLSGI